MLVDEQESAKSLHIILVVVTILKNMALRVHRTLTILCAVVHGGSGEKSENKIEPNRVRLFVESTKRSGISVIADRFDHYLCIAKSPKTEQKTPGEYFQGTNSIPKYVA